MRRREEKEAENHKKVQFHKFRKQEKIILENVKQGNVDVIDDTMKWERRTFIMYS